MLEQWATHQHSVDAERYRMDELEERAFRDMLITDREFWHMRMMEDDYDVELWNPVLTFYHKSPQARYISQSNWVGKTDMLTPSDVIDQYGYLMSEKQLASLEAAYPIQSATYAMGGYQNDGTFYDASRSHKWNTEMPSLAMRQYTTALANDQTTNGDIVNQILSEGEGYNNNIYNQNNLIRVTTAYWKSQRKLGHLTKIDEVGNVFTDIVTRITK